jgi:helix-turn-helix protein
VIHRCWRREIVRRRDIRKVLRMRDEQSDDLCDSRLKLLLCCGSAMRMVSAAAKIHRQNAMTVTGNAAQKAIATATGIDQSSISRWQRGTNTPSAEAVVAFARCTAGLPSKLWWPRTNCPALELGVVERRR